MRGEAEIRARRELRGGGASAWCVLGAIEAVESLPSDGEAVVVPVDDNKARIAIQLGHEFDIDLLAPRVLLTKVFGRDV